MHPRHGRILARFNQPGFLAVGMGAAGGHDAAPGREPAADFALFWFAAAIEKVRRP